MPEHVPRFVSAPPTIAPNTIAPNTIAPNTIAPNTIAPNTIAPNTIAKTIKSILAVAVFREFPTLKKQRFWGSGLWSDGCYCGSAATTARLLLRLGCYYGSAGTVSAETIKRYLENQKEV